MINSAKRGKLPLTSIIVADESLRGVVFTINIWNEWEDHDEERGRARVASNSMKCGDLLFISQVKVKYNAYGGMMEGNSTHGTDIKAVDVNGISTATVSEAVKEAMYAVKEWVESSPYSYIYFKEPVKVPPYLPLPTLTYPYLPFHSL